MGNVISGSKVARHLITRLALSLSLALSLILRLFYSLRFSPRVSVVVCISVRLILVIVVFMVAVATVSSVGAVHVSVDIFTNAALRTTHTVVNCNAEVTIASTFHY